MDVLAYIRQHKISAWLAGDRDAFLDWDDAELEELTRRADAGRKGTTI